MIGLHALLFVLGQRRVIALQLFAIAVQVGHGLIERQHADVLQQCGQEYLFGQGLMHGIAERARRGGGQAARGANRICSSDRWISPPRKHFTREKLKARVSVAFSPSTTSAWRRFSLLRRCAYSGELAMRRTLLDSAESMLKALATLPISMSGSCASSMMCVATPGGDGKFTDGEDWLRSRDSQRGSQQQKRIKIRLWQVSVRAGVET